MPQARRRRRSQAPLELVDTGGPPIRSVQQGRSKTLSICVYGPPGIGKTVLAGSSARLEIDDGTDGRPVRVLILRPPVDHTDSIVDDAVDEWVLHDWAEADDALLYCRNDGAQKYDWIWLDSISLWQDQGLDDIWEKTITEKPQRARYGLDKGEYGINMQRLGRWVRHMVGCPEWHFGITAHARVTESTEDEEEPNEKLMPWVQGKMMAPKVCGYMNVVGYMDWAEVGRGTKRKARVLHLNSTDRYYAKDQFTSTEEGRIIDPTMPKLIERITATKAYKEATSGNGSRRTKQRRRAATGRKG